MRMLETISVPGWRSPERTCVHVPSVRPSSTDTGTNRPPAYGPKLRQPGRRGSGSKNSSIVAPGLPAAAAGSLLVAEFFEGGLRPHATMDVMTLGVGTADALKSPGVWRGRSNARSISAVG